MAVELLKYFVIWILCNVVFFLLCFGQELHELLKAVEVREKKREDGYMAPRGARGRYVITKESMEFLIDNEFTNSEMGELFNVSRGTIDNRMK